MEIVIFEDSHFDRLTPLTLLRASYDIKTGVFSNKERIQNFLPENSDVILFVREELKDFTSKFNANKVNKIPAAELFQDTLFLNGRCSFTKKMIDWALNTMSPDSKLVIQGSVAVAKLSATEINKRKDRISFPLSDNFFDDIRDINNINFKFETLFDIINYPWDILRLLDVNLGLDLAWLIDKSHDKEKNTEVSELSKENSENAELLFVSKSAKVFPGVILDTAGGEIYIAEDAVLEPLSYIKGPVYIGKGTVVKAGSRLYGPVSIGWGSKVSGEISGSLFHSCVNKQHDGFIGNTYACPFVNFGADTVTSNLKNNYSKVKVIAEGEQINTGMQFLGTIAGDHTKFGINTMLNTGTIAGIFANVAGGGFPPKKIDSFSWNILGSEPVRYRLEEALETAGIVMSRRHIELTPEYKAVVENVFNGEKC
jgi:UDP-N-acetylglucosamine diphosphorylase/glucosamine-1-phosphate N-acetyltransferase